MTDVVATIDVFWDAEYQRWRSRRYENRLSVVIAKNHDKRMWETEAKHLAFPPKDLPHLAAFHGTLDVELHEAGYFVRVWARAPAVRAKTPAAAAARIERDWGLRIVFRRDKFYGRDRRGRRKFIDVEPLKVTVGEQRIPDPEDP